MLRTMPATPIIKTSRPRGRPRKHLTEAAATEAKRASNRRRLHQTQVPDAPADFIHYAPAPQGVPSITPPDLGLRISADIPVPQHPLVQLDELLEDEDAYEPPSPLAPLAEYDAEIATVIGQLQASEHEQINERHTHERRIPQQRNETDARTARILLEMQTGIAHTPKLADKTTEHSRDAERPSARDNESNNNAASQNQAVEIRKLHYSSTKLVDDEAAVVDESPVTNTRSVSYTSTPILAEATNASTEALESPQTPSQRSSISSTRSNTRGGRCRTAFPAQSNTPLSWVSHARRQLHESSNVPRPAQRSLIHSTPQPLPPFSNRSTPRLPQLCNSSSTPQPVAQGTAAAASPLPLTPTHLRDGPDLVVTQTASPAQATLRGGSPPTPPTERTAYKLAKQLRNFQGCTHEEHADINKQHQEHHQRSDVHSACMLFEKITRLISGAHNRGTPLPDVLSNPKLMKSFDLPEGIDLQAAFEGTSTTAFPEDVGTSNEKLPQNLCIQQHHHSSSKHRAAEVSFDIDSVCCFPSSLAFAQKGINWFPKSHAFLNIGADIHFGLTVSAYNNRGNLATRSIPLHKIPHCCFGSVIGIGELFIYIFFPELHLESQYKHSTYLSTQDQQLWLDAVFLPALVKTVKKSNLLQHYPASAHIVSLDATALAAESSAKKESAREQLLKYVLQAQHLDLLWTCILERIAENPGLSRFNSATLFAHAKNTKLEHMADDLTCAYERWEECWSTVADSQFYSKDRTYVDIAKQVTPEDSALPYDSIPNHCEAEVLLWKRCCLESYVRTSIQLLEDGKRARGSPRITTYPWATMRDTMGQTLFAVPHGQENIDGLVYSQMYALIKTPFDTSKRYVFDNEAVENLALDPGYVRSLQQEGGSATFSENVCKGSYQPSSALWTEQGATMRVRDRCLAPEQFSVVLVRRCVSVLVGKARLAGQRKAPGPAIKLLHGFFQHRDPGQVR